MDPLVNHWVQYTDQSTMCLNQSYTHPRAPLWPRAPIEPMRPRLSRPTPHTMTPRESSFYAFTQSFCYIVSYFSVLVSHLLHSQSFCYSELSQYAIVNLAIFGIVLSHFALFQSSCYRELNHFCYSTQISHFSTVFSHFVNYSAILV
jgi:hypothetical protein